MYSLVRHQPSWYYWILLDPEAVTINRQHYVAVLSKFYQTFGQIRGVDSDSQWFQRDGAMLHTSNARLHWLEQQYGEELSCIFTFIYIYLLIYIYVNIYKNIFGIFWIFLAFLSFFIVFLGFLFYISFRKNKKNENNKIV